MSKIKNGGLDQYHGTEHFEQQQSGTAGVGGVNFLDKTDCRNGLFLRLCCYIFYELPISRFQCRVEAHLFLLSFHTFRLKYTSNLDHLKYVHNVSFYMSIECVTKNIHLFVFQVTRSKINRF